MARTVRDTNLETRTARLRLPMRTEPYWRGLEKGFALGYRRRARGGTWLGRRRQADGGYVEHRIGTSDDLQDADGVAVLDYAQGQKAAREWWQAEARREEGHDTRQGPLTVADATAEYFKAYERRGGKAVYETQRALETHILPALGTTPVAKLTARKIADWHHTLAEKRARLRTKPGRRQNYRDVVIGPDAVRKRRATANRILTVLKAALNHAWKAGHVAPCARRSPSAGIWRATPTGSTAPPTRSRSSPHPGAPTCGRAGGRLHGAGRAPASLVQPDGTHLGAGRAGAACGFQLPGGPARADQSVRRQAEDHIHNQSDDPIGFEGFEAVRGSRILKFHMSETAGQKLPVTVIFKSAHHESRLFPQIPL
jgi:hypothetical protein